MTATQNGTCLPIADGVRVCVPDDIRLMTPYVLHEQGDWFEDEIKYLRATIEPGNHVVDIGANYGVYTLMAAKCAGRNGRVWAFEPSRATASWLHRSIAENRLSNVELIEAAVSNTAGHGVLLTDPNSEMNRLGTSGEKGKEESVALLTLDAVAQEKGWSHIEFIKIDAEGHETQVIEGGQGFFSDMSPLVMCEIKAGNTVDMGPVNRFLQLDYESYRLVPGLAVLVPVDVSKPLDGYQLNLFCCRKDCAERLAWAGRLVHDANGDGKFADHDWLPFVEQFAYGKALSETWKRKAGSGLPDGWDRYQRALNAYARSRTVHVPPSARLGALQSCYQELSALLDRYGSFPRLLSFARVAADLGHRREAVAALRRLIENIDRGGAIYAGEPFLAPSQEFEAIDPGNHIGNWMVSAVLDAYERRRAFSSYFSGADTAFVVSKLRELGFCPPEMERRLDLVHRRVPAAQTG